VNGGLAHPPKQARSRRTLERMVRATLALLRDRPFEEITVDEIVSRAGLTKGAFYHRFPDKAALLRLLNGEVRRESLEAWDAFLEPRVWADASLPEFLDALVDRAVSLYALRRDLQRTFIYEARWRGDATAAERARELNARVRRGLERVLASKRGELRVPSPERVAAFVLNTLVGVLTQALLFDDDLGLGRLETGELTEGLKSSLTGYAVKTGAR
jgi:AcrR family transcriptional regulator